MRAYVLRDIGEFGLGEVPRPALGENDVIVRVRAAGICGSDIPRIYYTGTYSYPLIPGHEFSGEVIETGKCAEKSWIGKRVGVFPLIPCGKCKQCLDRKYELCRSYSYLGSRTDGGFAEYVKVPEWNLIGLPDNVTFEQAAMLEPMAVTVHAMRSVDWEAKSTVAICGLGTIGLLLLSLLMVRKSSGNGIKNIFLIGNKPFQKTYAMRLGAAEDDCCDIKKQDADSWVYDRTGGQGVDVFFDCTGRNEAVSLGVRNTAPCGTILLVGNPASDMALTRQEYWKILRNQITVKGSWNSSFMHKEDDDWAYCIDRLKDGRIRPELLITHKLPFERLAEGTGIMKDKKHPYIKVMVCSNYA